MMFGHVRDNIRIDICSACHPFGKQKIVDTEGRVEKFLSKRNIDTVCR